MSETAEDGEQAIRAAGPHLIDLARQAIDAGLASGEVLAPLAMADLPAVLCGPGACFVTLKTNGRLRGCIGSPTAWRSLVEDVRDNAYKAAFRDPRFHPLTPEEMEELELSVSVLTPPVAMAFRDEADLLAQLRPRIDGLIIEDGGNRALFLPAVWEQLPYPRQFLAHLKQKAGLALEHWSANFRASRFQAVEIR